MQKILILGGTGRLGRVLKEMLSSSCAVTTLARSEGADIRGDVATFERYERYDMVINCAAMKDVAKCESEAQGCIAVNVVGVEFSLRAAAKAMVGRYIYISTDMAVDAHSLYGASKRVAERLVMAVVASSDMECAVVRLGNVIGSSGSIFSIFADKSEELGYVPVTHPDMTRFFMLAEHSAQFVASVCECDLELRGDIFAPCCGSYRILDVASAVAPERPVKIVGLRDGDMLSVTMLSAEELSRTTMALDGHYRVIPSGNKELFTVVDLGGIATLTSANNPSIATVEELTTIYRSL